jgi:virginiamycin B lyase
MRVIGLSAFAALVTILPAAGFSAAASAQTPQGVLSGDVRAPEQGAMAGVVVTASRADSPISVSVTSDDVGHYNFPAGRLAPGTYRLAIRAIGYDLDGPASVDIGASPAKADISLKKTKSLASQMTNAEWLASWPGADEQKTPMAECIACHTLERIARSTHTADEFMAVIPRMLRYANNSTPLFPQLRLGTSVNQTPVAAMQKLADYLASINLSQGDTFSYPLKTLPRVSGRGTRAIITEYALGNKIYQPHDVMVDTDGEVLYSHFADQLFGKLDPKTGEIHEYDLPTPKPNEPIGTLDMQRDEEGNLWLALMFQGGVAKFDAAKGSFQMFPVTGEFNNASTQISFVMPNHWEVDGKVWMQEAGSGSFLRMDVATGTFEQIKPFANLPEDSPLYGKRNGYYEAWPDSHNNLYFAVFSDRFIGRLDAKTGEITFYPTPTNHSRPRRGMMDAQDRIWFAEYEGNKTGMFDTKTHEFKEWQLPTKWMMAYDSAIDKNGDIWTGGMGADRIVRVNSTTGETTEYQLPHETNVRNIYVDNSTTPVTVWTGSNHGAAIVKLEPLD